MRYVQLLRALQRIQIVIPPLYNLVGIRSSLPFTGIRRTYYSSKEFRQGEIVILGSETEPETYQMN